MFTAESSRDSAVTTSATAFLSAQKKYSGRLLSYAVALGSSSGLLLIAQAWFLARVVNDVIFDQRALADVMPWLLAILALILLRAGIAYVSEQVAFAAAADIKQNLRLRLLRKIQSLGPLYLSGENSGELSTSLTDGVEALEAYYARYLPAMSLAAWVPLSILVFVFPFDWQSALVLLFTAPLIPFFMVLIGKGSQRLNQQQWKQLARLGGHFLDVIQGLTTLKLFNASKKEAVVIANISEDYRHATMKVLRIAFLSSLALEFFATVSIAIVAVLIGFRLLFGELDFITGFYILLLAPEFYLPLRSLGTHYHARMNAIAAVERIIEVLDTPQPARIDNRRSLNTDSGISIRFDNVHFSYTGRPALRGVNCEIQPREHIALVGPSGSGKTTMLNLLLGFIQPDQGRIEINHELITELDLEHWRRQIAWVPQSPRLFHGSVAHNLCIGLSNISQQQIQDALVKACADEFVTALPHGIDTLVGEGGQGLSGGQIQRLALARAFLRDAQFLIMDEPTAHLDSLNESLVQQAIKQVSHGRTLLTVAHRLPTIQQADRILVVDAGKVVQSGHHAQLVLQPGLYQQMIQAYGASQ